MAGKACREFVAASALSSSKKAPAKKAAVKAAPAKAPAKKAAAPKAPAAKRAPNPAFMKALTPSAALAKVIGAKALPRTEAVKQIWVYIKKHNLQDAANKRNINADANLLPVFGGKKQVSMFEMAKFLSAHLS
jgi:chromatin remodeling complex protein RSC6